MFTKVPNLKTVLQVAATVLCLGNPACALAAASLTSAFIAGVTSGLGVALKAGLIAGMTAIAFNVVGTATLGEAHAMPSVGSPQYIANVAGHAGVGCLMSVASGGSCGRGAASAAVGAAASTLVNTGNDLVNLAGVSAAGGLAEMAAGGKFANGAETAAFVYLFNAESVRLANGRMIVEGVDDTWSPFDFLAAALLVSRGVSLKFSLVK